MWMGKLGSFIFSFILVSWVEHFEALQEMGRMYVRRNGWEWQRKESESASVLTGMRQFKTRNTCFVHKTLVLFSALLQASRLKKQFGWRWGLSYLQAGSSKARARIYDVGAELDASDNHDHGLTQSIAVEKLVRLFPNFYLKTSDARAAYNMIHPIAELWKIKRKSWQRHDALSDVRRLSGWGHVRKNGLQVSSFGKFWAFLTYGMAPVCYEKKERCCRLWVCCKLSYDRKMQDNAQWAWTAANRLVSAKPQLLKQAEEVKYINIDIICTPMVGLGHLSDLEVQSKATWISKHKSFFLSTVFKMAGSWMVQILVYRWPRDEIGTKKA